MSLSINNLTKIVDHNSHLYGVNVDLEPGSLNVVLGPTLAGKTTLLRLLAGLDDPTTGSIILDGVDLSGIPVWKRSISMVYQQFINYPHLNVYENIAFPLHRAKISKEEITNKVHSVAEMLHIDELLLRKPGELSGGQQQRTALARSLVKSSDLLLLDEPLINLDYKLREQLREDFDGIFALNKKTIIIYTTTEPMEALLLAGNLIVLNEGRQLQNGPTQEIYKFPLSEEVARVFSDPPMNMISGTISNDEIHLGNALTISKTAHLSGLDNQNYRFGIRASALGLSRSTESDICLYAQVELGEISGSETFIHIRHNDVLWVLQEEGIHDYSLGQEIPIFFNPDDLYVFDRNQTLVASPDHHS